MPAAEISCLLAVKAVPNAPQSALAGWLGDTLKVKVHAPALEGRANEELCAFLARQLGLRPRAVTVTHGHAARLKLVRLTGLTLAQAKSRLGG